MNNKAEVETTNIGENRIVFKWKSPEYLHHEKGNKWYLYLSIFVLIIAILSAITGNITFAIAIITFVIVYYYIDTKHPPKLVDIVISELGIRFNEQFFHYNQIKSFWIHYEHGAKSLNFRIKNGFQYDICIQLQEMDPVDIRRYLLTEIPEWEGKEEKFTDKMLRLLKF